MKKGWFFALLAVSLMAAPANAKKTVWFETYDANHDGAWTYDEFAAANQHYLVEHPQEVRVTTTELRKQFDDLDTDHDGLVKVEQVRTYHTWE